jgi:hypothetical protein
MWTRLWRKLSAPAVKLLRLQVQLLVGGILMGASVADLWPLLVGIACVVITGIQTFLFTKLYVNSYETSNVTKGETL